jgi:hypothetical protein
MLGLSYVPVADPALAVAFGALVGRRLALRQEEWLTGLAEAIEDLRGRLGDADFVKLAGNPLFVDAVMMTARTVEHTH